MYWHFLPIRIDDMLILVHGYAMIIIEKRTSYIHRLECLSFLALDGFEWWFVLLFFLEVVTVENGFAFELVLVFLNIFQFPFSSEDIDLPLCEELRWLCSLDTSSFLPFDFVVLSLEFVQRVLPDVMLDVGDSLLFDDSLELTPDEENGAKLTPLEHPLDPVEVGEDDPPRWWWFCGWVILTLHSLCSLWDWILDF